MDKTQHRYQPLQNKDTVRILTLEPGEGTDQLIGTLEALPIDSAGSYEAVSYVWADPGPPNSAYDILIRSDDGSEGLLKLRGGSIFAALRRIRQRDRCRRIWADQCCINQDDPLERSQQVHFMNRVYRGAVRVLVWLGLDDKDEAVSAFALVHKLDQIHGNHRQADGTSRDTETLDLENHLRDNHKALQTLTDRAWVGFQLPHPTLPQPE